MVYLGRLGSHPLTILLKYGGQAIRTLSMLHREKPSAVFVMSPPVFACATVALYCALRGVPFVVDAHTAAFLHPRWKRFQSLQLALCRRAATTIVTDEMFATQIREAGGHASIVRDVPIVFPKGTSPARNSEFSVAVVCSFNPDEPVDTILAAASRMSDVGFYLTGDPKSSGTSLTRSHTANVTFTGFMTVGDYGALLASADAVMVLTTRDHTMLRGAYEAIYQGTPVIISDWPLLRMAFPEGAVHVDNSEQALVDAVYTVRRHAAAYRQAAQRLRGRKLEEWQECKSRLLSLLVGRRVNRSQRSSPPTGGRS